MCPGQTAGTFHLYMDHTADLTQPHVLQQLATALSKVRDSSSTARQAGLDAAAAVSNTMQIWVKLESGGVDEAFQRANPELASVQSESWL